MQKIFIFIFEPCCGQKNTCATVLPPLYIFLGWGIMMEVQGKQYLIDDWMSEIYLRNFWDIPGYSVDIPGIYLRYTLYIPELFLRYFMRYTWDMSKIYHRYNWEIPEICIRYAWYIPKICLRNNWDILDTWHICLIYVWDIPEIRLRYT